MREGASEGARLSSHPTMDAAGVNGVGTNMDSARGVGARGGNAGRGGAWGANTGACGGWSKGRGD